MIVFDALKFRLNSFRLTCIFFCWSRLSICESSALPISNTPTTTGTDEINVPEKTSNWPLDLDKTRHEIGKIGNQNGGGIHIPQDYIREMRRMEAKYREIFLSSLTYSPNPILLNRNWTINHQITKDGDLALSNPIKVERDGTRKFSLQFDLRNFKSEEVSMWLSGHTFSIHAKHKEETEGDNLIRPYREFIRTITLPKDVNPEFVTSRLSNGGILTIEAPLPPILSTQPPSHTTRT
ncbi:hypothetical protein FSP39_005597 [Pinctada imbricata]|uniref:SHSP domain-containing protein n=1 Tax=Pinctada imbricata TaxID=66713 RepID=A0AA88XHX9_PINIB|nr:hypothetical protein FSP39_005597 [Pinctada imbricata]